MATLFDILVGVLTCATCKAVELGHLEAQVDLDKQSSPNICDCLAMKVAQKISGDRRVDKVWLQTTPDSYRFTIHLLADAAEVHRKAFAGGLYTPGSDNETDRSTSARPLPPVDPNFGRPWELN